jgi:hypothetical protein
MIEVVVHCKRCGAGVPPEPEEKELLSAGAAVMARCRWCDAEAVFQPRDRWFSGSPDELQDALGKEPEKE